MSSILTKMPNLRQSYEPTDETIIASNYGRNTVQKFLNSSSTAPAISEAPEQEIYLKYLRFKQQKEKALEDQLKEKKLGDATNA